MVLKLGKSELRIEKKEKKKESVLASLLGALMALALAFLVAGVIISMSGANPVEAISTMVVGAFGSKRMIGETLVKATPLMLGAAGLIIAYRCGMISIGTEGQIVIGGIFATVAGLALTGTPRIVALPLVMIAAGIGGGIWGAIPGILKAKLGVSEVINTIMLNYIAIYTLSYLVDKPLREPPGHFPQSAMIAETARLNILLPGTRLHTGLILALLSVVLVYLLMWRSPIGYQMRAVGYSQTAAKNAGIPIARNMVLSMLLSGVFAGLAGAMEVAGMHHRLMNAFSTDMGFDALAVALLGKLHPAGIVVSSILFGALRVGANMMQRTVQVPASLVQVIQGLVIIFVLMDTFLKNYAVSLVSRGKAALNKGGQA